MEIGIKQIVLLSFTFVYLTFVSFNFYKKTFANTYLSKPINITNMLLTLSWFIFPILTFWNPQIHHGIRMPLFYVGVSIPFIVLILWVYEMIRTNYSVKIYDKNLFLSTAIFIPTFIILANLMMPY